MDRPVGVTVSAIVAILGSIFALLLAVFSVASLFIEAPGYRQPEHRQFVIAGAGMFAVLSVLGIWTAVGLLQLRSRARASILIFAGFLAGGCIFGLLVTMATPIPPDISASTVQTFRRVMAAAFGIPLAIAVWWLIQFNTGSTKAAFGSPFVEVASRRPLSITVVAWVSILGGVPCLIAALTRQPAFLFGVTFNGLIAAVIYAIFAALLLFIGKGLLDLREEARVLGIWWFGFSLLHMNLVALVPPLRRRLLETQAAAANNATPMAFDPGTLINVTFALSAMIVAGCIWFLVRNRAAFVGSENP
jgi:hypothetical protein